MKEQLDLDLGDHPLWAAAIFNLKLRRLDAMREAAAKLMSLDRIARDVFLRGDPEELTTATVRPVKAQLYDLLAAYAAVIKRWPDLSEYG